MYLLLFSTWKGFIMSSSHPSSTPSGRVGAGSDPAPKRSVARGRWGTGVASGVSLMASDGSIKQAISREGAAGKLIRFARIVRRLTQYELAERVGVAQPNISRLERGLISPSLATLVRLADAADYDVELCFVARGNHRLGTDQGNATDKK